MTDPANEISWAEANQRCLMAALAVVRARLRGHGRSDAPQDDASSIETLEEMLRGATAAIPTPPALDIVCAAFGLSPFERAVLVLCAGVELDAAFAAECAAAQGDPRARHPTFGLALAALPGAHWSALTPAAPLRRWRLVEVLAGGSLATSPLRIDERVLHFLTGVPYLDERLSSLLEPLPCDGPLAPSHRALISRIASHWSDADPHRLPAVQLCGTDASARRATAAAACAAVGLQLHAIRAADVPAQPAERQALARLWEREAALATSGLLIECDDSAPASTVLAFLESVRGATLLSVREPLPEGRRAPIRFDLAEPPATEHAALWRDALGSLADGLNGALDAVVGQFRIGPAAIAAAAAEVRAGESPEAAPCGRRLWAACRAQTRPRLEGLAQRIEVAAKWEDLVLPAWQLQSLREIAAHVRQRFRVYETWGFSRKSARGLGIGALFAGDSGTGKTMAAEVLAGELDLDLYRIDLSATVSKYIGETEKNLCRIFDAAEAGGAVLLFDEADALFGKRTEVKDSRDRFANIEVSYLLQRLEAYRGLAILTTNFKSALDPAFLRRLRFVVQFPFPDAAQRAEIWRRIFPRETPTAGLDHARLARLNIAGGNIRNIALHAAFLAADEAGPVCMSHLLRSARTEYAKIEKPLSEAEIGGWV